MLRYLKRWNTLRNQLLVVYLFVMFIVLFIVSAITYILVENLLQNNAEEQIRQTAMESSGRYDSLFEQLNMVTKQVLTNEELQDVLLQESKGEITSFNDRQSLMSTTNLIQANADGIYSIEIYNKNFQRIIPIDTTLLLDRIDPHWIIRANEAGGKLIWFGEDPLDYNYFLVGRKINLMDADFNYGGYIVARINRNYFQLNPNQQETESNDYSILVDKQNNPIVTNYNGGALEEILDTDNETIIIDDQEYMLVRNTSDLTGWTMHILTPVNQLTSGISTVQAGILIAGLIGLLIFFIFSFFLSTFITRPITRLTKTMRQAGEGVLAQNPVINSTNEINELNQTYNQLAEETNYLVQMVYEKEIIKNRTELKAIQAQIHPHFLFNTLDALYWSLDDKEEEGLANVVLAMSELFRYTITKENEDEWVTVKEELDHIERYMKIMRMRFGDRLNWEKDVDFDWLHVKIPKLMIQPIVENAILHGAGNVMGNSHITVSIEKVPDKQRIRIAVSDNGPGMSGEKIAQVKKHMEGSIRQQKQQGLALQNVQQRLRLFYETEESRDIIILSEEGKGTMVSFEIPV
ncbi:HAMP domain-containing protein [Gracilibacillus salitolerans]|uniref:HAMP domain-containing protein n=1 Tax=Gracilibacillus salitolerans TaxID=2663022 RepID=A0A5Q2TP62_9BACI|nr:sensor histidine kinase [Gracilibacillus salitolerans]QGH36515.1 HAMP domain-containing protein [Gracilibacillus salitolerans]